MSKKIKINGLVIYKLLFGVVLIGQISSRIWDFSVETNQILDTLMFSLIGIAYLVFAWAFNKKSLKSIFLACGLYLIVMNFLAESILQWVLAIVCVLTPLIIGRFLPEEADNKGRLVD